MLIRVTEASQLYLLTDSTKPKALRLPHTPPDPLEIR